MSQFKPDNPAALKPDLIFLKYPNYMTLVKLYNLIIPTNPNL